MANFLQRMASYFERDPDGRRRLPLGARPAVAGQLRAAAESEAGHQAVGAVLKLVHVFRRQGDLDAAAALSELLMAEPAARRHVVRGWSSQRARPRRGADLAPLAPVRAPHVAAPKVGLRATQFMTPGRDVRDDAIRRRGDHRKR